MRAGLAWYGFNSGYCQGIKKLPTAIRMPLGQAPLAERLGFGSVDGWAA
ncbi:hypothetical protein JCM19233_7121 [Vibrio astriarenae]|nr:hypothetical protein JCM19233_7121 [Vibrio sp. C7]